MIIKKLPRFTNDCANSLDNNVVVLSVLIKIAPNINNIPAFIKSSKSVIVYPLFVRTFHLLLHQPKHQLRFLLHLEIFERKKYLHSDS